MPQSACELSKFSYKNFNNTGLKNLLLIFAIPVTLQGREGQTKMKAWSWVPRHFYCSTVIQMELYADVTRETVKVMR